MGFRVRRILTDASLNRRRLRRRHVWNSPLPSFRVTVCLPEVIASEGDRCGVRLHSLFPLKMMTPNKLTGRQPYSCCPSSPQAFLKCNSTASLIMMSQRWPDFGELVQQRTWFEDRVVSESGGGGAGLKKNIYIYSVPVGRGGSQ